MPRYCTKQKTAEETNNNTWKENSGR